MPGEAYLRRVGALAVALGVGAAIAGGWSGGPAWADDTADAAGSTVSTSGAGQGDEERPAPAGPADPGDVEADDEKPTVESPDPIETTASSESDNDDGVSATAAKPKRSERAAAKPRQRTPSPPRAHDDADDEADPPAATETTTDADARLTQTVTDAPEPTESTESLRTASLVSSTVKAPAPQPSRPQPNVVGVVSRLMSGVVSAVLSPFAAGTTPGAPAEAPSMWTLLAFARREFESTVRSLTGMPVATETTSETPVTSAEPGQRTLILTAFPAETDAILARTTLEPNPTVVVDGRHFYLGTMGGKKVIVAMTGIGMINATETTETALAHFTEESGNPIGAVIFAGVAGGSGRTQIGSVAIPARWTSDDGETWHPVDSGMLDEATALSVDLDSIARLGDPLCLCNPFARLPLINLGREPQLFVGGDGSSDDNNSGVAFPAIPFGGSIFGPQPCSAPDRSLLFTGNFFRAVGPFLARGLLTNLTGLLMPEIPPVDAVDQETAAAQRVADAYGIPFLGIRGMSDGPGDPLNLPGYPFTFVVYNQVAADNAATVTEAFLQNWDGA